MHNTRGKIKLWYLYDLQKNEIYLFIYNNQQQHNNTATTQQHSNNTTTQQQQQENEY
jgi:hypothetical protein